MAALREAFDRDTRRLELEREQMEAERARAERLLRLELSRQAAEREMGRSRVVAGVAAASWLGTLFFWARLAGGSVGLRVTIGVGWMLLLAALAAAFAEQSRIAGTLDRIDDVPAGGGTVASGLPGAVAPWLLITGLAIIALATLLS